MKAIEKPTMSAIEEYALEFFALPVSQQNEWTQEKFQCSAITFRRWCNALGVKVKISGRNVTLIK